MSLGRYRPEAKSSQEKVNIILLSYAFVTLKPLLLEGTSTFLKLSKLALFNFSVFTVMLTNFYKIY